MTVRTLVAGVATPLPNDPVLESAVRLAERTGADLHLVHALAPDTPDERRGEVETAIEERVAALTARGGVFCRAVPGTPERVLAAAADEAGAHLLVLAPTRRGALAGRLLGTTAQNVLRQARVPVLVLHGSLPPEPRVLLTTDLSAHSLPAHARGVRLAGVLGAAGGLRTLHVAPPAHADVPRVRTADEDVARGMAELREFLAAEPLDPAPEPRVRTGEPATEIVREAAEWGADVLVLGTHGRTGAARWLLGSVAETVLRGAPCSVLVVPPAPVSAAAQDGGAR